MKRALQRGVVVALLASSLSVGGCDQQAPRKQASPVDTTIPDAGTNENGSAELAQPPPVATSPQVGVQSQNQAAETGAASDEASQAEDYASADDTADAGGPITNPDWLRRPSGEDMERYYPDRAARMGVQGKAVISCSVTAKGTLEGCLVVSETPADQAFGEAAVQVSKLFRMKPATRDGTPVAGATVRIPIAFLLPRDYSPAD